MPKQTLLPLYPEITYLVDRKKFKSPPRWVDDKRAIPGVKKALRVVQMSRVNGSNVWRLTLHLLSAN